MPTKKTITKTRRNLAKNSLSYKQKGETSLTKLNSKRSSKKVQKSSGIYTPQK